MNKKFTRYIRKNNIIDSLVYLKQAKNLSENIPIIVYQMGKVGSQSIEKGLKKNFSQVFHLHEVNPNAVISSSRLLFHHLTNRKEAKIITIVRDPIARNISSFFQNIHLFYKNYKSLNISEMIEIFFERFHHNYPIYWYRSEFEKVTGINIYNYAFDFNNKFGIIKQNNFDVLLLRVEDGLDIREQAISKFIGKSFTHKKNVNKTARTSMGELYQKFITEISFSNDLLNYFYCNEFVEFFYTKDEINKFKNKWKI